ncbi:cytochrome c biogenesis protein [Aggregatilinea lenta]|uniref:cytochrome c biogenesis protein n=1 Tax=Aggregatilinea lenta TaxID=913108 RepID=UPI000E5C0364|nr:cytochrome c biogenesis protein CcsA [Aggregatilinea lenta]
MVYSEKRTQTLRVLTVAAVTLFALALLMDFFYVGPEAEQGEAQRIFYVHLGSFLGAFFGFGAAMLGGALYLRTRNPKWDTLSLTGVETGLGFSAITIITGMAWARPIWNTWWTWDPRLTSVTIMWLAYAAYLMLRAGIEDPERKRRFAAVYAIVAVASVFFTIVIIRVRPDTIHPVAIGPSEAEPEGSFDMSPRIVETLLFNLFTFGVITVTLMWHRIRLENLLDSIARRKMRLLAEM